MSVNGYIDIDITTGKEHEEEARRWAKRHHYSVRETEGKLIVNCEGDGGWFSDELERFADEASDLAIPASEWKAEFHYTCEEGACDYGGNIHVSIADGKIASFQESRIEMVEVEPWCKFELEPKPEPKTFRYFGNVMAHVEFEVEAETQDEADELASEQLNKMRWDAFNETGHEIGRFTGDEAYMWEEVERSGEI